MGYGPWYDARGSPGQKPSGLGRGTMHDGDPPAAPNSARLYLQDISTWLRSAVGKGGGLNLEMDESLVGSPGFKPVREVLTLPWVGSIPTRLRQFPCRP